MSEKSSLCLNWLNILILAMPGLRRQVTSGLGSAKKNFLTKLSDNIHSPKDFWSIYYKLSPHPFPFP